MAERHPIQDCPVDETGQLWSLEKRVQYLECQLALLWDHVWWLSLPMHRRAGYEADGFRAPIERFYLEDEPKK